MQEARFRRSNSSLLLFVKWLAPTLAVWIALSRGSAWLALGFYHAIIATVVVSARPWQAIHGISPPRSRRRFVAVLTVAIPIATYLLFKLANSFEAFTSLSTNIARVGLSNESLPYFASYFCIANGVLEELYWRRMGPRFTLMRVDLNDVLYAMFHVPVLAMFLSWQWLLLALASLIVGGATWRNSVLHSRAMTAAVASHVAANAALWYWVLANQL